MLLSKHNMSGNTVLVEMFVVQFHRRVNLIEFPGHNLNILYTESTFGFQNHHIKLNETPILSSVNWVTGQIF